MQINNQIEKVRYDRERGLYITDFVHSYVDYQVWARINNNLYSPVVNVMNSAWGILYE